MTALERTDGIRGCGNQFKSIFFGNELNFWVFVAYVLDPKAITKEQLFGTLDATTREVISSMIIN